MRLTPAAYVLTAIIVLISVTSVVLNGLILAGTGNFVNTDPAVSGVSLACSVLLLLVCAAVCLNCSYVFGDKALSVRFGVLGYGIPYGDMLALAVEPETGKLYLQYRSASKKRDFDIIAVNIDGRLNDSFVEEVRKRNPDVSVPPSGESGD